MPLRAGVVGSLLVHGVAALALVAWQPPRDAGLTGGAGGARESVDFALAQVLPDADDVVLGKPTPAPLGPADHAGASASPFPNADVDAPDRRRADRGGGAPGASPSFTARDDREELRDQLWNDPARTQVPRLRTADDRATTEA